MPLSLRRARPPGPLRPEQVRRYSRAVRVALLVLLVMAAATLWLRYTAERGAQAERELASITGAVHAQDAVGWRTGAGEMTEDAALTWTRDSHEDVARQISRLSGPGLDQDGVNELLYAHHDYSRVVERELGEADSAAAADPMLDTVLTRLQQLSDSAGSATLRTRRLSDSALVVALAAAAVMIGLLGGGRRLARVLEEQQDRNADRNRLIAEQSSTLIAVVRRDGTPTFLTPAAERILDVRPDEPEPGDHVLRRSNQPTATPL